VNVQAQQTETPVRRSETIKTLREAILVAAAGVLIALAANQISPRGLKLTRDYFPGIKPVAQPAVAATHTASAETSTNVPSEADAAVARLKSKGLQVVDFDEVKKLLHDPGFQQNSIIFIDARDDEHYQAGHIPGAYQLDYYHPDKYLATVLPVCQSARQIVVYCAGGDCEDSEMTALMLRDGGVPNEKLFVYSGGMTEWDARKEPIETGAQNSGQMLPANK
jgi:rhodanese-related sulfurtransferase